VTYFRKYDKPTYSLVFGIVLRFWIEMMMLNKRARKHLTVLVGWS